MSRCLCGNELDTGGYNGLCSTCRLKQVLGESAAPHGSRLPVEQILNDLEAGRRVSADEKLEAAKFLLSEVMQWHSNTDSNDYNECDKDPCHWCANARLIVGANRLKKPT